MTGDPGDLGFATRAVHAGQDPDPATGAVVPAVHLSTTFRQRAVGEHEGYEYSRSGNPTRAGLQRQVASLEEARFAFAFASGLAAEDAVLRAALRPADHVVLANDVYGGTYRLVARVHADRGVTFSTMDLTDPGSSAAAMPAATRVVWLETPSNPLLRVVDIAAAARAAHNCGALLVVDNTFATPYLQQPLKYGADAVVHSSTKYLGGHSDVVGGVVAVNDPDLADRIAFLQNAAGAVPGPFDCYLVQRGVKTLPLRMDRHCANAAGVAAFLSDHPAVAAVHYPGLPSDPGHQVASGQMRGYGGIVSFRHAGGEEAAVAMVARTRLFTLAESLGAVESLIEHPARMTHASVADSPLAVDPSLIRLSVGIETLDDLVADLAAALSG